MNKKLFASALFAVAAFVSTIASAAITYDNSVTDLGAEYLQDANAKVVAGGNPVRANDIIITVGGATDIPANAEVILRLPPGLNFDGNPSYLVSPATPTLGLTLKDGSAFGDPTLDDPGITLADANADGGNDRALVTVGAAGAAGDKLYISANIVAASGATVANNKKVSVIINNGLAVTQNIADVVTALGEPVQSATGTALATDDQVGTADIATSTALFTVTIPKGTAGGKTITLTPQSKLTWGTSGSTVTYTIHTPVMSAPFTVASGSIGGVAGATSAITITMAGASTTSTSDDIQVQFSVNAVDTVTGGTIGLRGVTVGGTAGITGTASLVDIKANGSSAKLTTAVSPATNDPVDIVAGSTAVQMLPSIDITENFDGDAIDLGGCPTCTITITPGAGLVFAADQSTIGVSGVNWGLTTATVSTTTGKLTLQLTNAAGGSPTVTITGIGATAASTASGSLSMTVGSPSSPDKSTAPSSTLVVANAVSVGGITLTGPATPTSAGVGSAGVAGIVTLKETTYGAMTLAAATQVQSAYMRVTLSSNATPTAVVVNAPVGYTIAPAFSACTPETGNAAAYLCVQTAESGDLAAGSSVSVTVTFNVKSTAVAGETVTATFDGNNGVSGTATLASIGVSTTATKGVVPDLTPGVLNAQSLATLTVTDNFPGSTSLGLFRLVAPAGVAFDNTAIAAMNASVPAGQLDSCGTCTITVSTTFNADDTLVIPKAATSTLTVTPQAVIAPTASGWLTFTIADGGTDGAGGANVTGETIALAYADGTLGTVDAGADDAIYVGFNASNTVDGGLAPYTASSSSTSLATVAVNGTSVIVTGVSAGVATITVTDGLGQTDTFLATVSAASLPTSQKTANSTGGTTLATFSGGFSGDSGGTFGDTYTIGDELTFVGEVNVDPADQGQDGTIVAALKVTDSTGPHFFYLDTDKVWQTWDLTAAGLGAHEVAEPLAAQHTVTFDTGALSAGTYVVFLGYTVGDVIVYANIDKIVAE